MGSPRVQVTRVAEPERCAFCHDSLTGPQWSCAGCKSTLHADCAASVGCPVMGCAGKARPTSLSGRANFAGEDAAHDAAFWRDLGRTAIRRTHEHPNWAEAITTALVTLATLVLNHLLHVWHRVS